MNQVLGFLREFGRGIAEAYIEMTGTSPLSGIGNGA
jgi:hypothetical protein